MSYKISLVGLEGSGKTTLAKVLNDQHQINNIPLEVNEDMPNSDVMIFCLDGSNMQQLHHSKAALEQINGKEQLIILQTKADIQTIEEGELRNFLGVGEVPILPISAINGDGLPQLLTLLSQQVQPTQQNFSAEPRVVPSRGKYRINEQNQISKPMQTFQNLMKDHKIKQRTPMEQEQEYIRLEKERIKVENMSAQLNNFKRKLKKEDTYDIKATANPRIQVNLEFFLTDTLAQCEQQKNTLSTQTDKLQKKPEDPPFIPKKTGIDAATQVEDYELFDFDREVTPILNVICTKTLEQACLEIEQEEEFLAMYRFKEAFEKRRVNDKTKQQVTVEREKQLIDQKTEVLKKYSQKQERMQKVIFKAQAHAIAKEYLKPLQGQIMQQVISSGFYPNEFMNQLQTMFMDYLVGKTQEEVIKLVDLNNSMKTAFNVTNFEKIPKVRKPYDQQIQKKKDRQALRMINYSNQRAIRIFYQDLVPLQSVVSMTLPKFLDGSFDEWKRTYDQRVAELEQKAENNEINEEDFANQKRAEYPDLQEGYFGASVNNFTRFAFSMAHDQYYLTSDKRLQIVAYVLRKDGTYEIVNQESKNYGKVFKWKKFRLPIKQTDDEALLLRLQELDSEIIAIVFGLLLPNLQNNIKALEWVQNARFGLYDAQYCIPFAQTNVNKAFKLEELVKQVDDPELAEAPQTVFMSCFTLMKRFKQFGGWYIENTQAATKGMLDQEIEPFYEKLSQFLIEMNEFTLERDRDFIQTIQDKEKERDTILTNQELQMIITKSKIPQQKKMPTEPNVTDSALPSARPLEEPSDYTKTQFNSMIIEPIILDMSDSFETVESQLINHLTNVAQRLVNSCTWGFELKARGNSFLRVKQLIRIRSVGEMTIVRKPEPPKEEVPVQQEENKDNDDNDNDS
ncbi:unnamed protein product (macronuclear) [Paramecium tetraurelia]|uniref:Uncharacterized protein n=1 Tax=Paramecium tetraurelia TaxID=5888 RepID=A0CHD7_PARTE|nr:uncharacterized protein GSPATT00038306001 [Paramecium tetraurelia]CAK70204.1 unnamed protein product [Paramecium tetraurelia]|eukprot:XP_001437601.1 hypothetical protein (macronuclear) [Paramecium tetraurelia strain d4-2]